MSLGDKLKNTVAVREFSKQMAEESRRREKLEKVQRARAEISAWFDNWKQDTIQAIEKGLEPRDARLPHFLDDWSFGIDESTHPHYDLFVPFRDWAKEEGLRIWIGYNEGKNWESWWEIGVRSVK